MDFSGAFSGEHFHREVLVLERKLDGSDVWNWCSVFDNMNDLRKVVKHYPEWQFRIFSLPINDDVLGTRNLHSIADEDPFAP